MSSFVLDKESFVRRIKRLYTEWKVSLTLSLSLPGKQHHSFFRYFVPTLF